MNYQVTIYCPDRHIIYDARMPERKGVGGGITARLSLAQALANQGSRVTVVANVPRRHTCDGVVYEPLDEVKHLKSDVLILNSTGGALDLSPVLSLKVECKLTEIWVGGVAPISGISELNCDHFVVPSNFIREALINRWQIQPQKIFVVNNGFQRYRPPILGIRRDPFRLVYTSHPSKGLESAIAVLRFLRDEDRRFELHVFGGNELWGGQDQPPEPEPGIVYHGKVGQRRLSWELRRSGASIHLQAIEEAFGISLIESMASGSIVVASPVGAYAENIRHGYDGFLIPGNHEDSSVRLRTAALILELTRRPDFAGYVRRNAQSAPFDWSIIARAWQGHWRWLLKDPSSRRPIFTDELCTGCSGELLPLADGYHCVRCGLYARSISTCRSDAAQ